MNKEKLYDLIYVLLRDSLTIADMEGISEEVQNGVKRESSLLSLVSINIADGLLKSTLKCSENMCNTEYDDVQIVKKAVFSGSGINERTDIVDVALCADCRKREANLILVAD